VPIGRGRRRGLPSILMERIGGLQEALADVKDIQVPGFRLRPPPEPSSSWMLELYDQNP
jgi:hypothetical protein